MLKFAYLADLEFRMLERLMLSYIWRWLPAEDSGPDQRRLVLLDSYALEHADLPLIFSDRYVWSQNGWDSHKFDQCHRWASGSFEPQHPRRSKSVHLAHYRRVDHVIWVSETGWDPCPQTRATPVTRHL